jgi:putative Holliday junction resolvase
MRILAIDPGEKNIGIAISDPTGTIANPLTVLRHISRPIDAAEIAQLAREHGAGQIIVGQALDEEGQPTYSGRKAARLAAAIRTQTDLPVQIWDESHSTQLARAARIEMGSRRARRSGHLDELAATVILQSYLDAHGNAPPPTGVTP